MVYANSDEVETKLDEVDQPADDSQRAEDQKSTGRGGENLESLSEIYIQTLMRDGAPIHTLKFISILH